MKKSSVLTAVYAGAMLAASQAGAEDYINPLTSEEGLIGISTTVKPVEYNGHAGLQLLVDPDHRSIDEEGGCDNCTVSLVQGLDFGDGTIEVTLSGARSEGAAPQNRGFVGLVFRAAEDESNYEGIYFRPHNSVETVQERRNHTVQYFAYPDHYWRALRAEFPGRYESWAPIQPGEWTDIRVEVEGETAQVFVNDIDIPVLVVNDLRLGADQRGTVGLFTEPDQDAFFRNLRITHAE